MVTNEMRIEKLRFLADSGLIENADIKIDKLLLEDKLLSDDDINYLFDLEKEKELEDFDIVTDFLEMMLANN